MPHRPLLTRPRYFTDVTFHRHTARSIQWLELFYDLVYVATLIQIGNFLSDNVSVIGFGQFIVLMTAIWWAWTGETIYQNRYVTDDLVHRGLVFLQIFAIASFGLSVSQAFGPLYVQFTIAYVIIRGLLIVMYLRAMRLHPESAVLSRGYVLGFTLGAVVWLGSLLLPAEWHWVGWLIGIAIELMVPLVPGMRRLRLQFSIDPHHLAERFGIFTLIVLGEAFVKVLDDAQGTLLTLPTLMFSTVGLLVMYTLWWLYYSDLDHTTINLRQASKNLIWLYAHLPLVIALVTFGVAAKKAFEAVIEHPADPLYANYRLLYAAAVVIYLLALALIEYGFVELQWRRIMVYVLGAGVIAGIGILGSALDPTSFVAVVMFVMLALVLFTLVNPRPQATQEHEESSS
jgi:low temperature requirement protein LtrA